MPLKPTIRKSSGVPVVLVRVVSMFTWQVCEIDTAGVKPWAGKDIVTVSPRKVNIRLPGPRST
jgi:hypothetical protein